jgi:hypothetical protein
MTEKQYTYDIQVIFDGTGDDCIIKGFKTYLSNPEDVKLEVKSLMVVRVWPEEVE